MNLRTTQGKLKVNVQVPDEAMDRCDLVLIARGPGHLPDFADVAVNGQPVKGRSASAGEPAVFPQIMINRRQDTLNPDWKIKGIDLMPFRGKSVEITGSISLTDVPGQGGGVDRSGSSGAGPGSFPGESASVVLERFPPPERPTVILQRSQGPFSASRRMAGWARIQLEGDLSNAGLALREEPCIPPSGRS